MSDINKEIDAVAEQLEKSTMTPKEILFDTIRQLGPDAIKAKFPTLEKSEQVLLFSALQEMSKAVSMDDSYSAKYVQGKVNDTKIQEDKADDDQDEKLVKPEAATIAHQGTPTEGWEGQVIKAKEPKMSKDKAKEELMEMEEKEHKTKDPKKLVAAEKKEQEEKKVMKKGDEMETMEKDDKPKKVKKMADAPFKKVKSGKKDEMKEGLKEIKKSVEDQLMSFGITVTSELVKGEMKRLLAEEDQDGDAPEMNEKTRANKEAVAALELAKDNKEAQKKVNDEKQGMKKATAWAPENALLKAMTGGRNHHFSMEEYINEVLKEASTTPAAPLAKSEAKEDLNDIIAKGQDASWDQINCDRLVKANVAKQRGKIVKSFEDNEIAQALGLTPEEAKKILGE